MSVDGFIPFFPHAMWFFCICFSFSIFSFYFLFWFWLPYSYQKTSNLWFNHKWMKKREIGERERYTQIKTNRFKLLKLQRNLCVIWFFVYVNIFVETEFFLSKSSFALNTLVNRLNGHLFVCLFFLSFFASVQILYKDLNMPKKQSFQSL